METNNFISDDILLASFLITQGIQLIEIIEDYPHHFTFHFSDKEKCTELKRSYFNNASASARQLFSTREMLITEIKTRNGNKYETSK